MGYFTSFRGIELGVLPARSFHQGSSPRRNEPKAVEAMDLREMFPRIDEWLGELEKLPWYRATKGDFYRRSPPRFVGVSQFVSSIRVVHLTLFSWQDFFFRLFIIKHNTLTVC